MEDEAYKLGINILLMECPVCLKEEQENKEKKDD